MKNMEILFAVIAWSLVANTCFAAPESSVGNIPKSTSTVVSPRMLKLDDAEIDMVRLEKQKSYKLGRIVRKQKSQSGQEVSVSYERRVQYSPANKHIVLIESKIMEDGSQGNLKVYDASGNKKFERKLELKGRGYSDYEDAFVVGAHHVVAVFSNGYSDASRRLETYDTDTSEVVFSTGLTQASYVYPSPSDDYILLKVGQSQNGRYEYYKYDFKDLKKISVPDGFHWKCFSNDGKYYLFSKPHQTAEKAPSGDSYTESEIQCYFGDTFAWKATIKYEALHKSYFSITGKYLILELKQNRVLKEGYVVSWDKAYYIFKSSNGKLLIKDKLSPEAVAKYENEEISDQGRP